MFIKLYYLFKPILQLVRFNYITEEINKYYRKVLKLTKYINLVI